MKIGKQEARLIFYLTYLYEQMILVPPHILIVRCIALWVKSTSHRAREEWRFYVHMYNILHTHLSSSMQQPLASKGGVSSDKVLFTPSEKRSSLEVGFFLELCNLCVTYAQHDSLSLFERFLFFFFFIFTEIPGSSSWNSAQKFISYVISHLVPPKNDQI